MPLKHVERRPIARCIPACRAPPDRECVLVEELNLSKLAQLRHGWPFLRDRRIDAYEGLTRRFIDRD